MFLLFDIGGTKTRVSSSTDATSLGETLIFDTPPDYQGGKALLIEKLRTLTGGEKVEAIAGGIAGPFSQEKKSS